MLRRIKYPGAIESILSAAVGHAAPSNTAQRFKEHSSASDNEGYVEVGSSEVSLSAVSNGSEESNMATAKRILVKTTMLKPASSRLKMKILLSFADSLTAGAEIRFDSVDLNLGHMAMLLRVFLNESSEVLGSDAVLLSPAKDEAAELDFRTVAKIRAILNERNAGNANISLKTLLRTARDQIKRQVVLLGEQCSLMAFCRIGFTLGKFTPWSIQWINKAAMLESQSSVSITAATNANISRIQCFCSTDSKCA